MHAHARCDNSGFQNYRRRKNNLLIIIPEAEGLDQEKKR